MSVQETSMLNGRSSRCARHARLAWRLLALASCCVMVLCAPGAASRAAAASPQPAAPATAAPPQPSASATAAPQQPTSPPSSVQRAPTRPRPAQDEFVPVEDLPDSEKLPAAPFLIAAYTIVWLVLLAYVWSLWSRLTHVERELKQAVQAANRADHA